MSQLFRFLVVPPASLNDAELFQSTLEFLSTVLRVRNDLSDDVWRLLSEAMQSNLLKLLEKDHGKEHGNDWFNELNLSVSIMTLVRRVLDLATNDQLERLLKSTDVLENLKTFALRCFSEKQTSLRDRQNRVESIYCLLRISRLPQLRAVPAQAISGLIALLTQTLGCLHQNFSSSDTFSHQDRLIFRLIAMTLRCCSRAIVEPSENKKQSDVAWGPHWLFDGGLDWLVALLADDEIKIQACGIGIISNLILIRESYKSIMVKIPNFLDMAFAYAMDNDRNDAVRKEAILVINNFFYRFCQDCETPAHPTNEELIQVFKVFENCLFFERLTEMLNDRLFFLSHPTALIDLLLNIGVVAAKYLREQFVQNDLWHPLLHLLLSKSECDDLIRHAPVKTAIPSYEYLRCQTLFRECGAEILQAQQGIIKLIELLCSDPSVRSAIAKSPSYLRSLAALIYDIVAELDDDMEKWHPTKYQQRNTLVLVAFGNWISDFYVGNMNLLVQVLGPAFVGHCIRYAASGAAQNPYFFYFLAKLINLHSFIEVVQDRIRAVLTAEGPSGVTICGQLVKCLKQLVLKDISNHFHCLDLLANICEIEPQWNDSLIEDFAGKLIIRLAGQIEDDKGTDWRHALTLTRVLLPAASHLAHSDQTQLHTALINLLRKLVLKEEADESQMQNTISVTQALIILYQSSSKIRRLVVGNHVRYTADETVRMQINDGKQKISLPSNRTPMELFKLVLNRLTARKQKQTDLFRLIVTVINCTLSEADVRAHIVKVILLGS